MTAPIQPDPPPRFVPGPRGLSQQWQDYFATPFARDTLGSLVRGRPVQVESDSLPPAGQDRLRGGTTNLGNVKMFGALDDEAKDAFTHEIGHVIDLRSQAAGVTDSLRTIFQNKKPEAFTYDSDTGNLPAEYVAETFRMAMGVIRSPAQQQDRDLEQAERSFPGITLWYNWIKSRLAPAVVTQP
jgi:hypothetical protein